MIMLPPVASLLPAKGVVAAIVIATCAAAMAWQHQTIRKKDAQIAESAQETKRCQVDLGVQSAQVHAWKNKSDELSIAYDQARKTAAQARSQSEQKSRAIYALNLPQEECHALALLVDTARAPDRSLRHPIAPE